MKKQESQLPTITGVKHLHLVNAENYMNEFSPWPIPNTWYGVKGLNSVFFSLDDIRPVIHEARLRQLLSEHTSYLIRSTETMELHLNVFENFDYVC